LGHFARFVKLFWAFKAIFLPLAAGYKNGDIGGVISEAGKMLRLHQLPASLVPVLVGIGYAFWSRGAFSWPFAVAVLVLAGLTQLGGTFLDDYFDHRSGVDWKTENRTLFSGGGGLIQSGLWKPLSVLVFGLMLLAAGLAIAFWLAIKMKSAVLIGIYSFGLFSGIFYTAPPLALAYRGWGEVAIAANYGPTAALLGYVSQTGAFSFPLLLVALTMSSLILAVIMIHEMMDYQADRAAGKKSWVVQGGVEKGKKLFALFLFFPFGLLAALVMVKILPLTALLPFGILAWSFRPLKILRGDFCLERLFAALVWSFIHYILFGLALTGGLVLDSFIR